MNYTLSVAVNSGLIASCLVHASGNITVVARHDFVIHVGLVERAGNKFLKNEFLRMNF